MLNPEIKESIEKTYQYVRDHGKGLEAKLLKESPDQFPFLDPLDENHSYYLSLFKNTQNDQETKGDDDSAPPQPPAFIFSQYDSDQTIDAVDLEVIKKTAEFVIMTQKSQGKTDATGTDGIIQTIIEKYKEDEKFKFLDANHKLYPIFRQFLEQYSTIVFNYKKNVVPQHKLLQRCLQRAAFKEYQNYLIESNDNKQRTLKLRFAAINWIDIGNAKDTTISLTQYFPTTDNEKDSSTADFKIPLNFKDISQNSISNNLTIKSLNIYFADQNSQKEGTEDMDTKNKKINESTKTQKRKGKVVREAGETRLKRNKKK